MLSNHTNKDSLFEHLLRDREYFVPDVRYELYLTRLGELIIVEPLERQLSFLTAESDKVYVESQGRNILFILHVKL